MAIDDTPIITIEDVCTTNLDSIPQIPVYRPTFEEFSDFAGFIEKIEARGAHHIGLCKIIPPEGWVARKKGYTNEELDNLIVPNPITQTTVGNDGIYVQDIKSEKSVTYKQYREYAFTKNVTPTHMDWSDLERKYWSNLTYSKPQYGANVSGTLTDKSQKIWNIARLPTLLSTVLEEQNLKLDGVNTPYLYFGSWQTTFGWHVEDVDLYSINYLHHGMPKHWYVIPPAFARKFEMIARDLYKADFLKCNSFLRHKTVVLSPHFLRRQGIPTRKIVQEENEFMYTFPYGYHAGFNMGLNIAESTNFAGPRWIEFGKQAQLCQCWPDTVKINMEPFVKKYQPQHYEHWKNGTEDLPHPLKEYEIKLNAVKKMLKHSNKRKAIEEKSVIEEKKLKINKSSAVETDKNKKPIFFDLFSVNQNVKKVGSRIQRGHPTKTSSIMAEVKQEQTNKKEVKNELGNKMKDLKDNISSPGNRDYKIGKEVPKLLQGRFKSLWRGNQFNFQMEKQYNELIGSFYPHCAVCSIIWPVSKLNEILTNGRPSCGMLPKATEPHIPQMAFYKDTENKLVVSSVLKSPIMKCSHCNLTVHARCYGAVEVDRSLGKGDTDIDENWTCDRCVNFSALTHCSLCSVRGGALKKLTNRVSGWAHIVCTLGCQEMIFEDLLRRKPRMSENANDIVNNKCSICKGRQSQPICKCAFPECRSSVHVTCAFFHNVLIESETYPHLFFVICMKHPSYYAKQPTSNAQSSISIGDSVYARSPSTGYYYHGTVEKQISKAFCKLIFPSGEYSDDTEFEFIKSHNILKDGPPTVGTVVTVLWTNGELYETTFQGIIPEKWKISFHKLNSVIEVSGDQIFKTSETLPPHVQQFVVEDDKYNVPKRRESARIAANNHSVKSPNESDSIFDSESD